MGGGANGIGCWSFYGIGGKDADQLIDKRTDAARRAVLNRAFACALREIGLVDRSDDLTKIVAEKIMEAAATGIDDPEAIARAAIKRLGLPDQR